VGIFSEQLMACAASVQVGPTRQSFWALHLRDGGGLRERTRLLRGRRAVRLEAGRMRVDDGGVVLDLLLEEDAGVEAVCPNGRAQVWTRKQAGVACHGTISLDGAPASEIRALAVIDDTAGHHSRHTEWRWTAGVGESPEGVALAWNLVAGVNDPETGSERAVWIAGEPREAPPVTFSSELSEISCSDGSRLHFLAEAERSRSENLVILKSDYRAPFGTFAGVLPGHLALAHGLGVVEHHRALW
jgi:hypothetical protein